MDTRRPKVNILLLIIINSPNYKFGNVFMCSQRH